jgi:hypothetical protein
MSNSNIKTVEKGWSFWMNLPDVAKAVIAVALPIVATSVFIAWFTLAQQQGGDSETLTILVQENRTNWDKLFQQNEHVKADIDSIIRESRTMKTDIADLTLIVAKNTNNRMLNELLPILQKKQNGIDETYRIVLDIQKSLVDTQTETKTQGNQ